MDLETAPERALYALMPAGPELLFEGEPGTSLHGMCAGISGGVYTATRTYEGVRFLELEAHLNRLERNLEALGFGLPLDRDLVRRSLDHIVRSGARDAGDVRVRIDVLPKPPARFPAAGCTLVTVVPNEPIPRELFEHGVAVRLTTELRRTQPTIKTTAWIAERDPLPLQRQDCYEHVLVDERGRLLECTSANFFGVRDGAVEAIEEQVLEGIMRGIVQRLMRTEGVPSAGCPITVETYEGLDEAFLTSSTRGIMPVVKIEQAVLGSGRPGPVTKRLMDGLEAYIRDEARPAVMS